MKRLVQPELLDTLPPEDPRAVGSRRDLCRINWWMGNHAVMARALRSYLPQAPTQITELGAGDGNFLLCVVQKFRAGQVPNQPHPFAAARATLLDLQKNISVEMVAAFAKLGWHAEPVVADVFDWMPADDVRQVVIANLFLHHFEDERLAELLGKVSQNAKLFVAIEPYRFGLPSLIGQLLWLIGCNAVTRHDATISIRAGFAGKEIATLWPDKKNWQLTERRAGLFSHVFIARRRQ